MTWWIWIVLGLVLMGLELLAPGGFHVMFFGVGAVVVGILVGLGLVGPAWAEWALFSAVSILSLVLFRSRLLARVRAGTPPVPVDTLVGELAIPAETLAPGATGKVELRGTVWTARNDGAEVLAAGRRCRVTGVDGLTLWIRGE